MARGVVYRLLSLCFCEPEPETRQILVNLRDQLCNHFPQYCQEAEQLQALFGMTDDDLLDRKVEYARLFLSSVARTVPPYGSVYLEEERKLMGESTMAVQRFYGRYNLKLEIRDAPDHIAVELEFMHYLACADPLDGGFRDALEEFTTLFAAPWLHPFAEAVAETGVSPFYTHLSRLTADFVVSALAGNGGGP